MKNIDNNEFEYLDNAFSKLKEINNPVSLSQIHSGLGVNKVVQSTRMFNASKIVAIAGISTALVVSALFWQQSKAPQKLLIHQQASTTVESRKESPVNPPAAIVELKASSNSGSPEITILSPDKQDKSESQTFNIEGVKLTQLSSASLTKLGVTISQGGICVQSFGSRMCFTKNGTVIDDLKKEDTPKTIFPNLITDDLGQYWRAYNSTDNDAEISLIYGTNGADEIKKQQNIYLMKNLNSMVAILVRENSNESIEPSRPNGWRRDVILWYRMSDEFLKLLPDSIAREMKVEYAAAFPKDAIKPEQVNKQAQSRCDYFEVCRTSLKVADNITVSPNPVKDKLNISFGLKEERSIRFNLLDITGRQIKKLSQFQQMNIGEQEYSFDISEMQRGMYLITVESSKGEVAVQRLIKE